MSENTAPCNVPSERPDQHPNHHNLRAKRTYDQLREDSETRDIADVRAEEGRHDERDGRGRVDRRGLDDRFYDAAVPH